MLEPPIGFARVRDLTGSGVAAVLESPVTVPVASRIRVRSRATHSIRS